MFGDVRNAEARARPGSSTPRFDEGRLFAFEALHGDAFEFAVGLALFDVLAFVVLDFAFADGKGDFDFVVFPVEGKGHEGVAFDCGGFVEFANFGLVEEQFARGFGLVVLAIAKGVFVDVGVVEEDLAILDAGEGVGDLGFAGAQGFDFCAVQNDAGFVRVQDVVIAAGFGIGDDVRHSGESGSRRGGARARLTLFLFFGWVGVAVGGCLVLEDLVVHFVFDDFAQGDVGRAQASGVRDERAAAGAAGAG